MPGVKLTTQAYCKMLLHGAKYPHCAVNGLLVAERQKARREHPAGGAAHTLFVDCIPLFHGTLALAPMLEVALTLVSAGRPNKDPGAAAAALRTWSPAHRPSGCCCSPTPGGAACLARVWVPAPHVGERRRALAGSGHLVGAPGSFSSPPPTCPGIEERAPTCCPAPLRCPPGEG